MGKSEERQACHFRLHLSKSVRFPFSPLSPFPSVECHSIPLNSYVFSNSNARIHDPLVAAKVRSVSPTTDRSFGGVGRSLEEATLMGSVVYVKPWGRREQRGSLYHAVHPDGRAVRPESGTHGPGRLEQ